VQTFGALLDEEPLHLAVGDVAGPHDEDVGDRAVADPPLVSIEDPAVTGAPGGRLQRHRVRAVQRLGQGEGADRVQRGHAGQPPALLVLRAEHGDGPHREPGLHAEEGAQTAVATVEFHVYQADGERAHRRAAVAVDAVADHAELGQLLDERPGKLGPFPVVVDDRQHLEVDEVAGAAPVAAFLLGELVGDVEVVGAE
jgi:hypothetical protein